MNSSSPPVLGLIALGESHRPDFDHAVKSLLPECPYTIAGALDDVPEQQIQRLADQRGNYLLRVPAAGKIWEIPRDLLIPYLEKAEQKLKNQGTRLNLLMCAGMFPAIASSGILLYPGVLLLQLFQAIRYSSSPMTIGLILPNQAQIAFAIPPWKAAGFNVLAQWADPHDTDRLVQTALAMREQVDVLILNCLGFNTTHQQLLMQSVNIPVITPLQVALNTVSSLIP